MTPHLAGDPRRKFIKPPYRRLTTLGAGCTDESAAQRERSIRRLTTR